MPDVIPFLTYEDGIAALEWLAEVFGFTETARFTSADGVLSHGEMSVGDGLIMLASPSRTMKAPGDIATTARLPPHGPLCHGSLMVFSSMLTMSTSTMLGPRPRERLSCLNRRMGRQRDDIELRI